MTNLLNNFLCHDPIILEAEDDLFPGIDSSVLGEIPPKDKEPTLRSLRAQYEKLRDIADGQTEYFNRIMDHLEDNNAYIAIPFSGRLKPDEIPYREFDWYGNYSQHLMDKYAVSKNSPLFNNIEEYISKLNTHRDRIGVFSGKALRTKLKIEALQKTKRKARRKAKK